MIPSLGTITSTEMSVARFSELTTHKALSKAVNGDFRMPLVVVAGRRILHSSEAQLLDAVADRNRFRNAPALIDVHHQIDIGSDRLADQANALDLLLWRESFDRHLNRIGALKSEVGDWKDLFWETAYDQQGD